ncbi:MAG TPA: DUF4386 domain-containing protein [Candidatus Nanopelagicaceae bacterium]
MTSSRKTAKIAAIFYLLSWVTSIAGLALYGPILDHTTYKIGSIPESHILLGAFLEILCGFANIGTALSLYSVVRRANQSFALGYVVLRTLEAAIIMVGVLPLLALLTLQKDLPNSAGSAGIQSAMVAMHNWSFIVGPSLICGINTMTLAYVLYRSGLVARFIPVLGLLGGALVFFSGSGQIFGLFGQVSIPTVLMAVPVFAWEISLASFLFFKGFKPDAEARLNTTANVASGNLVIV